MTPPLKKDGLHPLALRSAYTPLPPAVWTPPARRVTPTPPRQMFVPRPKEITDGTRQAIRRCERGKVRCSLCLGPVPADDFCFADGQDAHRSCAETLNDVIIDALEEMKAQRDDQAAVPV